MDVVQPEQYDEFGDIVQQPEKPIVYERTLSVHDKHRIHQTKDLIDGDCALCQDVMNQHRKTYWGKDE